jgi:dipeptidyl aminopeptidase/acylaminoacyl peptidase
LRDSVSAHGKVTVTAPRAVQWRSDAPATLVWAQSREPAETSGHPRDRVYIQRAPFTEDPVLLIDLDGRFGGVWWGRKDFAVVISHTPAESLETRIAIDPSAPGQGRVLQQRRYRDSGAGRPMMTQNEQGMPVMQLAADGRHLFLQGSEASRAGRYPFLARMHIASGEVERLWDSAPPYFETPVALVGDRGERLLVWRESQSEPPNLYVVDTSGGTQTPLTGFEDPAPEFARISRRLLTYRRADGMALSGTLYLPPGYDQDRDGPLPLLMWAYPAEYASADSAERAVGGGNRFVRPQGVSPLFMLTQGYAVLSGPSMPIIGADGAEPNDTYVEQLVMDAEAAVRAVVDLGIADPDAIAIGGHSYGAFMAANLLAHTDLFRAGIALSGAYNRTLTPFGFQSEQRSYWEAVDAYTEMSPFTHVGKINEPILLVHGGDDSNTGTFPLQSERFYAALKGTGATARYVMLPLEGHGYHARESVMHVLWEMTRWLDRHVKPAALAINEDVISSGSSGE